nr:reverse transcriptase domain-containing protein [Tanacetum cinerariifolium]
DVTRLQALVDKKKIVISEVVIHEILQLDDAEGIVCLPNEEIFAGLTQMGYEKPSTKLTFYKAFFSSQWKFLIHTILQSLSAKRTSWNEFSTTMASAEICLSEVGDLSTHTTRFISPALTQKVFANMRRVGKGFLGVETPLLEGMLAARQPAEDEVAEAQVQVDDVVAVAVEENVAEDKLVIIKLKVRVKKLQKANMVKSSKLRRFRKVGASRRIESFDEMEDVFNQGRMIDDMDKDEGIKLVKDDDIDNLEVQEVVEVMTSAKLITDVVTAVASQVSAASGTIPAAKPSITAAALTVVAAYTKRRKGVIIRDPEKELSSKTHTETPKVKDKGKGILVETPKPMKKKDQIELDAEYARKLHEEINRDHDEFNKDIDWDAAMDHVAKRRKLSEEAQEAEDLRKRLEVVDDADDDVFIEATPLARKVPDVDYQIVLVDNKPRFKIIKVDETHQLYISFTTLLKNFDKEDLEKLWGIVKDRFSTSKPTNFFDEYLLLTLKTMFEKPDEQDAVWKNQRSLFLLVKRRYPLLRFTLEQLVNVTRLQVEEESEMSLELISFTTLLKNFDREDLENLWGIVKDRFSTSKPNNFSDEYLLHTLKTMFEKLDRQDAIWRNQKSVHGLALVKSWKLLTSCGVHIITLSTVQIFLLVERRYPLSRFTLEQLIMLLQEFDIEIKDKKGTENVAADHLSRINNDETSDDSEVNYNFPGETLMEITTKDEPNLFPPLDNPELTIRRRSRTDPTLLNNSEMAAEGNGDLPFDHLPRNSINTFEQMAKMFLRKYFPPFMVTKLRNKITNFHQHPNDSLFGAWECYKLSIDLCPNHNMLPITQIDTFYNGLTLRHHDTVNVAAGGTFTKRRPEECYDLIENMTAHYNDWDTSAQQKNNKNLMRVLQVNQQVKAVTPSCETCGGPHSFNDCSITVGDTQNFMKMKTASSSGSRTLPGNIITNPKEDLKGITTRSGTAYQGPMDPTTSSSLPLVVKLVAPIIDPIASPFSAPRPNQKPLIPYPSRLHDQKLRDKANDQREKFFQIFKDLNFNISFVDALILMPKFGLSIKSLLTNKDKLCELARTLLNEHCSAVLLKKLPEQLRDPDKFLIQCDYPGMAECLALPDLGASINQITLSVWNKLSLPDFSPMCMTLELADRLISRPVGVAEDVFVKVGQRVEKHFRPIHYTNKTMNQAETNYTTTKKEMLAVVYGFEKFRSYLIMNKSIVYTDHSVLKYLFAKKKLLTFSKLVIVDPPEDTTEPTTQQIRFLTQ